MTAGVVAGGAIVPELGAGCGLVNEEFLPVKALSVLLNQPSRRSRLGCSDAGRLGISADQTKVDGEAGLWVALDSRSRDSRGCQSLDAEKG